MKKMKRFIHIQKSDREFIMSAFGVKARTVQNALRYDEVRGNTEMAKCIRKLAMERGGIVMNESVEVETLHDADGYIRQYMPNGVMLEISKKADATCDVFQHGDLVRHYDNVTLGTIGGIQDWAMTL